MVSYKEFIPAPALRDYIRSYWLLDSEDSEVSFEDIILPCGCIDIIYQKYNVMQVSIAGSLQVILPRFIVGPQSISGFTLIINGKVKIFGVRLHAHAAKSLLGFSPTALRRSIWALQDVFNTRFSQHAEQVVNAPTVEAAVAMMDLFFLERLSCFLPLNFMVKRVSDHILQSKGEVKLQEIFCQYRETRQTLRTQFLKEVGMTPKDFITVIKFQHALSLLNGDAGSRRSLTDVALEAGYYDQAHFIRTFKEITGLTPGQYDRHARIISRYFTL